MILKCGDFRNETPGRSRVILWGMDEWVESASPDSTPELSSSMGRCVLYWL